MEELKITEVEFTQELYDQAIAEEDFCESEDNREEGEE